MQELTVVMEKEEKKKADRKKGAIVMMGKGWD